MSQDRISKAAGWVSIKRLPRGPDGRCLCRRCGVEVPVGRRTFCSAACVDEHKIRTNPGYVRRKIFERDAGVCRLCGVDAEGARATLRKAWRDFPRWLRGQDWNQYRADAFTASGVDEKFRGLDIVRSWWDADHIVAVIEGGGGCGLDGYRTLCVPCHRGETAALRRRLAKTRRAAQGATQTTGSRSKVETAAKTSLSLGSALIQGIGSP